VAGLIVGGEERDARLVEQLAQEYIQKESCIILVAIACESMSAFTFLSWDKDKWRLQPTLKTRSLTDLLLALIQMANEP
jgi:hypothetical protein